METVFVLVVGFVLLWTLAAMEIFDEFDAYRADRRDDDWNDW